MQRLLLLVLFFYADGVRDKKCFTIEVGNKNVFVMQLDETGKRIMANAKNNKAHFLDNILF